MLHNTKHIKVILTFNRNDTFLVCVLLKEYIYHEAENIISLTHSLIYILFHIQWVIIYVQLYTNENVANHDKMWKYFSIFH